MTRGLKARMAGGLALAASILVPASASAEVLFNNIDETSPQSINSQDFNPANNNFDAMTADDFVIPAGEKWKITGALVRGTQDGVVPATSANVSIFADAGGTPGAEVFPTVVATATDYPRMNLAFTAPELSEGTYWFGVSAILDPGVSPPFSQWYWAENDTPFGSPAVYRNPGNGFGTGCTSFAVKSTCVFNVGAPVHPAHGQSFNLSGTKTVTAPPPPPPSGDSAACTAAKEKLERAKDKLKKAKEKATKAKGDAKKKAKAKVKKAKDAVKKAQAAVGEAC